MKTHHTHRRAIVSVLAAACSRAACSSAPTRYYTLQPSAAAQPSRVAYSGPAVQVSNVHVPSELDRDELLRVTGPGQVEVLEFDHWTASLGKMAQQTLSEDLATRLPAGRLIYPDAPKPLDAANLSVDILSFRIVGGTAVMKVSWTMRLPPPPPAAASVPVSAARSTTVETPPPPPAPVNCGAQLALSTQASADAAGTSASFSALLGQLSDRITDGLSAACQSSLRAP